MREENFLIDDYCFVCGVKNRSGLGLKFQRDESLKAVCSFTIPKEYQGYGDVIHGGILSTILDELMIYALFFSKIPTVTAKMEVTFKQKVRSGELLHGEGWLVRDRGKMVEAESRLFNAKQEEMASAKGLFAKIGKVVKV